MPLPPPRGGGQPKTERPPRIRREHPITHHVTDPPHGEVADRDKPGRPRAPRPAPPPRHAPPSPSASQPNNTIARLTRTPGTEKQQRVTWGGGLPRGGGRRY